MGAYGSGSSSASVLSTLVSLVSFDDKHPGYVLTIVLTSILVLERLQFGIE